MSIYSLTKEPTGGVTIIQDGNERFFGATFSPEISVRGNTLTLVISRYTYKFSTTDNGTINSVPFSGTIAQLKAAIIPVFPKANTGTGGTGSAAWGGITGTLTAQTDLAAALAAKAGNLTPTAIKTTAYTAAANELVKIDATSATVPITLPTGQPDKTRIAVKMIAVSGTNTATITTSSTDVFNKSGGATSATLSLLNQAVTFQYESATGIWSAISSDVPLSQLDLRYSTLSSNITYPWLTTFFRGNSLSKQLERLFVGVSLDGESFDCLEASYTSTVGTIRDPSCVYWNNKIYVCHTTGGFGVSTSFDIASWNMSSYDSTGRPTFIHVATVDCTAGLTGLNGTWAPTFFIDSDNTLHIIVSLASGGVGSSPYELHPTATDLSTWSAPVALGNLTAAGYDTFLMKEGTTYHAFVPADTGTIKHFTCATITGSYADTGNTITTWQHCEAPQVIKLAAGSFRMYMDYHQWGVTYVMDSADLTTWTNTRIIHTSEPMPRHMTFIYNSALSLTLSKLQKQAVAAKGGSFNLAKTGTVCMTDLGWTTGTNQPASGGGRCCRFIAPRDMLVTQMSLYVTAAAAANDPYELSLWDSGMLRIATTGSTAPAETSAQLNSTGIKIRTLSAPVRLKAGRVYYAALGYGTGIATTRATFMTAVLSASVPDAGSMIDAYPPQVDIMYDNATGMFFNSATRVFPANTNKAGLGYLLNVIE